MENIFESFNGHENEKDPSYYDDIGRLYMIYTQPDKFRFASESEKDQINDFLATASQGDIEIVKRRAYLLEAYFEYIAKDAPEETIARIEKEMASDAELQSYINEKLPYHLVEEFVHWKLTLFENPEGLASGTETREQVMLSMKPAKRELAELIRLSLMHPEAIKQQFEEQFGNGISFDENQKLQLSKKDIKSKAWEEYEQFMNLCKYVSGEENDKDTESAISNEIIENPAFRELFIAMKESLSVI